MDKTLPPSRTADQFIVRLPDGMRERISEVAKTNGRSMNAEIVARLEVSFSSALNTDESRWNLLLKDSLIGELMRETIRLRHNLLHLAILIERIPNIADPALLPNRCGDIAESAREYAVDLDTDLDRRGGMTPELIAQRKQAMLDVERSLARTRAFFSADKDKLLELMEQDEPPTLEQLLAIQPAEVSARRPARHKKKSANP